MVWGWKRFSSGISELRGRSEAGGCRSWLSARMLAECNLYNHHEALMSQGEKKPLPVVVVTGPLGAGKTTLVERMLDKAHNLRLVPAPPRLDNVV